MARIRTIKPEFWTHEDLSSLPEATHMLAAALLNHADDEGYFNANPGLVKAACCPLREPSVSIHDSLKHLSNVGFVQLGDGVDGRRYGRVVSFADHQRINRPTHSKISSLQIDWEDSRRTHTQLTEDSPPERNREQGKEQGREWKGNGETSAAPDGAAPPRPAIPYQRIVDGYNAAMTKLPAVREITTKRRAAIRKAWQESPARQFPEFFDAYWEECASDSFRNGNGPYKAPHENWRPDFDFLIRSEQITKVYEAAMQRMEARP